MSSVTDLAYRAGWRMVRALPQRAAHRLFQLGADRATRRNGRGIQRLRSNLRRVIGDGPSEQELEALVRAGMRSYGRYWAEAFRLPSLSRQQIVDTFHLDGEDLLRDQAARGRGVVVALPHSANWDHAGAWASLSGLPLTTVVERLKPEDLYQRFLAYRESLGLEILPSHGGTRSPLDVLTERLRAGRVVVLIADRDLSARGVDVQFFGAPARMPVGPALLSLRTGAPLLTASLWYEPGITRAAVTGPIRIPDNEDRKVQIADMTQAMADQFAAGIAKHPQDWHMLQKLWLDTAAPVKGHA